MHCDKSNYQKQESKDRVRKFQFAILFATFTFGEDATQWKE